MRAKLLMAALLFGALAMNGLAADDPLANQPPEGWKEFVSPTKVFSVWLPKGGKRSERNREVNFGTAKLKLSLVQQELDDKTLYVAGQVALPVPAGKKIDSNAAIEMFRDGFLEEIGGKILDESDVKLGKMGGKEYLIQVNKDQKATLRLYCAGPRIYQIAMVGTKEQVEGKSAKLFFDSFKHQGMVKDDQNKAVNAIAIGKEPTILGHPKDPQFKDMAPPGGLLVGFEIGLGKYGVKDMTRSVRPIYRVGDKESLGVQFGTDLTKVSTLKAKAGYAVGAITCRHGLGFDGLSITFMKVVDGKLDPKDSYESEWIGTDQQKAASKLGDGTPVIGIVGRANEKDMTGLGLLFKGQEGFEPNKK